MAWSSAKQASEGGGFSFLTLEIDVTDPSTKLPNSGEWTRTRTLYFADYHLIRDLSVSGYLQRYDASVLDWGVIQARGVEGSAISSIADLTITLANAPAQFQEAGSDIGGTVTALNPEPDMDRLRLSELFRLWQFHNATARLVMVYVSGRNTDITDTTNVDGESATIYTARIGGYGIEGGTVTLDLFQTNTDLDSLVGGSEITESFDPTANGARIPIVYGDWSDSLLAAGDLTTTQVAYGFTGAGFPLIPVVPWKFGATSGDRLYAWLDAAALNQTNQPDYGTGGAPAATDLVWLYHEDTGALSRVIEGTTAGTVEWIDDTSGGSNAQLYLEAHGQPEARTVVQCEAVAGSSGVTDPDLAVDRKFDTHATLDASSTSSYLVAALPQCDYYGDNNYPDEFLCYVSIGGSSTASGVTYDIGFTTSATVATSIHTSSKTAVSGTQVSSAASAGTWSVTVSGGAVPEPNMDWNWSYTNNGANDPPLPLYVFIKVTSAGTGNLDIAAIGIRARHTLGRAGGIRWYHRTPFGGQAPVWDSGSFGVTDGRFAGGRGDGRQRTNRFGGPTLGDFYVCPSKCLIDDASGTFTGSAESNIDNPADICRHLIQSWGRGLTASNVTTSGFGSFATARSDIQDWVTDNVTGGTDWIHNPHITGQGALRDTLNRIAASTPLMLNKSHIDGKYYVVCYPGSATPSAGLRFQDSASADVQFHPNLDHTDAADSGKPYNVWDFECGVLPFDELLTDIRVRYGWHAPTGALLHTVYANPDEQKVWNETNTTWDTASSGTLVTATTNAETLLGTRKQELTVEAPDIQSGQAATGFLWYLTTILTKPRSWVRFACGPEATDILPGHCFQISNDMNLHSPHPKYGVDDWEDTWFMAKTVSIEMASGYPVVRVYAEEVVGI